MEPLSHPLAAVRSIAEQQHGVISRAQLLEAGVGVGAIRVGRRSGRLVAVHPGVYALGHRALRAEGRWMVAVLAAGEGAALSHRSAALLWGLRPWSGVVEITVPHAASRRRVDGARLRRSRTMVPEELTRERGIPTTTVARTLLDLAAVVPAHHLRRAVERADQRELFDLRDVRRALEAHPRHRGRRALNALLADARAHDLPTTRSDPEAAFLQLCLDHDIPRPQVNRHANGREVDFRWPEQRLIVEVDGWSFHRSRRAFEDDRARDRAALRGGQRVARFPAGAVEARPATVAAELLALLASAR